MSNKTPQLPATLEENHALILAQQEKINALSFELSNLKRLVFGQKSERFIPAVTTPVEQGELFKEAELPPVGFSETKEKISYERRKRGHGRNPIPSDLYTEVITLEPSDEEKRCACGRDKFVIGQEETTKLEYRPAILFAKKYIRPKYACKCPESTVTTASLPAFLIPGGIAGTSLIAWIIISKFIDGLPLYRLESIFKRYGIHINRSSMDGWLDQVFPYFERLVEVMLKELLASFYVQADETFIRILESAIKGKSHLGYFFPFVGDGRIAIFDYREGRGRTGPTDMLKEFEGKYLMTDGYAGYHEVVEQKKLTHLICWAHARRGIFEAKDLFPAFSKQMLDLIKMLYAVEEEAREKKLDASGIHALRLEKSKPVITEIEQLLQNPGCVILPQDPMGKAIAYCKNHWTQLNNYLSDGRLPIDNNLVERLIRTVAIARKNFLFCASHRGARRMAAIYSVLATCKLNDINPYEYLTDMLNRIVTHPQTRLNELTPVVWKAARQPA